MAYLNITTIGSYPVIPEEKGKCANCNCLGDCMTPFHLSSLVLLLHCVLYS